MRFASSIPGNVLLLTETVEHFLEYLDNLSVYSKRGLQQRCTCPICPSDVRNSSQKLDEEDHAQLLEEVEAALQNASLVWDVTHRSSRSLKRRVKSTTLLPLVEQPKPVKDERINPSVLVGNKSLPTKCRKAYKPAHLTAPYRTEAVKPRKHPKQHSGPPILPLRKADTQAKVTKSALCAVPAAGVKTDIFNPPSSSIFAECSGKCATLTGDVFACTCLEERKQATVNIFVDKSRRLRSLLKDCAFGRADSSAWNFLTVFNSQLVKREDHYSIVLLLSRAYEEAIRLLGRFRCLAKLFDMSLLDAEQVIWIRQVFERFLLVRDRMQLCLQQVSQKSLDTSDCSEAVDDPLGVWLSRVKENNSVAAEPPWTEQSILEAYFTIGRGTVSCPRLFSLTSPCNSHVLCGTSEQRDEFIHLWDAVESEQLEANLLHALQPLLPKLTSSISSRPNRASLFRELYGLISSSYPVALKDTFGS